MDSTLLGRQDVEENASGLVIYGGHTDQTLDVGEISRRSGLSLRALVYALPDPVMGDWTDCSVVVGNPARIIQSDGAEYRGIGVP
jgi:hypothetical protein